MNDVDELAVRFVNGVVAQTDLLAAIAGDLPELEGEDPSILQREEGSLLVDGMTSAFDLWPSLGLRSPPEVGGYHTVAGIVLSRLGRVPSAGDRFEYEGWRFEVVDMDGRRIDKLLVTRG